MKVMRKINERKINKLYTTIIKLSQKLGVPEWTQELETNNGNINVIIKIEQNDKQRTQNETESVKEE